jgi:hypothetical protein
MAKIKEYFQVVAKVWYKGRDFVSLHPNVALITGLALAALNLWPRK